MLHVLPPSRSHTDVAHPTFFAYDPCAMTTDRVSRRTFLQATAAGVALGALSRPAVARQAPSDHIVLGMIGVGNMGTSRLRGFLQHQDVRIGAVCDVDSRHLDRALGIVETAGGQKPKALRDYRRVLDDREIDAVVVVTPDHWHAIPTVRAFEAGKDVFVEKPLSYSIAEGRAMADASLKYKRVSQMGNHIHNDFPNYRRVVELVKSGSLGRITRVHVWKTSPTEAYRTTEPPQRPSELDYDFWLGPAPKRDYHPMRSHILFRHFWDYSGGTFIDFWCHIVDVAVWALDLKAPTSVSAAGGRFFAADETETPDMLEAVLEYPGLLFTFSFQPMPPPGFDHMGHIGCIFEGAAASLVTNYQRHEVWVKGKLAPDFPRPEPSIPDSPGHLREFLDAIKSRHLETTCNVRYGHRVTKAGLLANIAYRTGRRLYWDDARERFRNDGDADKYLKRKYRKPYKL
jgi:predicted dehydrogenase